MNNQTRRELLADIGRGMVVAGIGSSLAADLGVSPLWAKEEAARLSFGELDNLVDFIQGTPADKIIPLVVEKLNKGTSLKDLVAAAALANARAFGGDDYVGFHTLMALAPAYAMAMEETDKQKQPLAVLKVLYRNATRMAEKGGLNSSVLKQLHPETNQPAVNGEKLRELVRNKDLAGAEKAFAGICQGSAEDSFNSLMVMVDDGADVHRVVMVSRSWDLLNFVGKERAHTLLRQSVHYCVNAEQNVGHHKEIRDVLPKVMDQHRLLTKAKNIRQADDKWVEETGMAIFKATPAQAAGLVGAAIAEGFNPVHISEAITLAANQLVLRDRGRFANEIQANKPEGSIHGDSIGVHACDSAHAWRNIAMAGDRRTQVTSLVMAGYQVSRDRMARGGDFLKWTPYPRNEHLDEVKQIAPEKLMMELDAMIRAKNQAKAAALAYRLSTEGKQDKAVFALFREFAISEDGALHAEKYYRTVMEDYTNARPTFRASHLAALARVTASAYGQKDPGCSQAKEVLRV